MKSILITNKDEVEAGVYNSDELATLLSAVDNAGSDTMFSVHRLELPDEDRKNGHRPCYKVQIWRYEPPLVNPVSYGWVVGYR